MNPGSPHVPGTQSLEGKSSPGFDRLAGLSPGARQLLQSTTTALQRHDQAETRRLMAALQALAPTHPEVLRLRAAIARLQGQRAEAIEFLRQAVAARPDDRLARLNMAHALAEEGDLAGAVRGLRQCAELEPSDAGALFSMASILERHGDIEGAHNALREGLQREPGNLPAQLGLARMLQIMGRINEAGIEYRSLLAQAPDAAMAWFGLSTLRSECFGAADLAAIERIHARTDLADDARAAIGFALAKALEDQGRHPDAYPVLVEANALWRQRQRWDTDRFSQHTRAIETAFSQPPSGNADPDQGDGIVFIVGMPRSGSSLIEQILAAHPQIAAGGELEHVNDIIRAESQRREVDFPGWIGASSADDWSRLGAIYLSRIAARRGTHAIFTDKALLNWRYIGALRAMLPGARFVDCRRDPVETCLACFRQMFMRELGFTYDLGELAAFWKDYDRAMLGWNALHDGAIIEVVHERLIANPEKEIRRLLDFCGLTFDPACQHFHEVQRHVTTASAAQVREPLSVDTARAHLYGNRLDELRKQLLAPAP